MVNTSSIAGIIPLPNEGGAYTTAKLAVRAMSDSLRMSLAPEGIGVSDGWRVIADCSGRSLSGVVSESWSLAVCRRPDVSYISLGEATVALLAYRFFSNNCREAMTTYQRVLGGELELMTAADMPADGDAPSGLDPESIMHAALTLADGGMLMASDDPTGDGGPVKGVSLHFTAATVDEAERIFADLADGGEVTMPLEAVFWALRFGSCNDRFGTSWMISVDHPGVDIRLG